MNVGSAVIRRAGMGRAINRCWVRLPKTGAILLTIDAVPFGAGFTHDEQDDGSGSPLGADAKAFYE